MTHQNFQGPGCRTIIWAAVLLFFCACVKDPSYNVDKLDNVDLTLNLFGEGLELPLGGTDSIKVGELLQGESLKALDSLLKKDAYGNYTLSSSGNYNLDEVISSLHLEDLKNIDGTFFTNVLEYKTGDFDPSQFKIDGKQISCESEPFENFNLDDIPIPEISAPDQIIATGMYKYLPSDMDLGKKIGKMEDTYDLLKVSDLADKIPSALPGAQTVSVQTWIEQLGKSSIALGWQHKVDESITFGDNASQIADARNFTLKSGGTLRVDLSVVNCPLTGGSVTPDIDLDISSMLNLADAVGNKLDLSGLILSNDNGWTAGKDCQVSSLADKFPQYDAGKLVLKGLMDISGNVLISNASSTPDIVRSLTGKNMQLKVKVSLDGVVLDEMDITLGADVSYSVPDVKIPLKIEYTMPEGVRSVEKVYFRQDRPLQVSVTVTSLKNLRTIDKQEHISVNPDIEITFPEGLEVEGAVDRKVTVSGDLYDGDIRKTFTILSIVPECSGKKLSFDSEVSARVKATASGSFSSKYLPATEADDIKITAGIKCTPALTDYDVTLDKDEIAKSVSLKEEFSYEIEGLSDFGTFRVELKGNPAFTLDFSVPQTTESSLVADNLVITLPQMMKMDGSSVQGFDPVANTVTLNGKLPDRIELPIEYLLVTPQEGSADDKTVIKCEFTASGKITVSDDKITRTTFDELDGKKLSFKGQFPSLEARAITLEGDLNKSLDYEAKDVVILDSKTLGGIPKEVCGITELDLDNVNTIIEIALEGLPDIEGTFFLKGTRITLPEFLYGENGSHQLILDDEMAIIDGKAAVQTAALTKIKDVTLEGVTEIRGDVKFTSSLYSHKPSLDISTLKSTIKATVKIGVGNGQAAEHPGKIAIDKALVRVGYDVVRSESITFGQVDEALQEEDVNLALNPQMHLVLTTNFGAPVKGDFIFTPYIKGKAQDAVKVSGVELPCSDDWNKTLSNKYVIGSDADAARDEQWIAADLSPLLRRIPDSIVVAINVAVDKNKDCVVYPAAQYVCDMDYALDVPVSFGDGFALKFKSDLAIDDEVNQYIRAAGGMAYLDGEYKNSLPLGVDCTVSLLDSLDRVVELNRSAELRILPGEDGEHPVGGKFTVTLSVKDPDKLKADRIRFNFSLDASGGVNLKDRQFLRLEEVKLRLPNGISVNPENK